jgi:hypothetical protein
MRNISPTDPLRFRCDVIVGTRPEAIKLAPVVKALRESTEAHLVRIVTSGQHGEICHSALAAFGLATDYALNIEPVSGSLANTAASILDLERLTRLADSGGTASLSSGGVGKNSLIEIALPGGGEGGSAASIALIGN